MQGKRFSRRISLIFAAALVALLFASPTGAVVGYVSKVLTLPYVPVHDPVPGEPTTNLTLSGSGDDRLLQIPLPFPFTFYGETYTQAWVSENGFITFQEAVGNQSWANHCPIPLVDSGTLVPVLPNGAIYAFWDDLFVDGLASMWTEERGTAPDRQYVIEWRYVTFIGSGGRLDFEIVLHETGAITLQYRVKGIDQNRETGNSATIGLESPDGRHADRWGQCNFPSPALGESAIQFSPPSTGPATQPVAVDIKPGDCLNPFNSGSQGVLPVAILGTDKLDVREIDQESVRLVGVPPVSGRWSYEDVGTPNQCNLGPDGRMDLTLKFDSQAVARALGTPNDGQQLVLSLTGTLRTGTLRTGTLQSGSLQNGTPISGQDKVIIKKGR